MKKLSKKAHKKMPKFTKFELACHDETDKLSKQIDMVLEELGFPESLVTDESYISDFMPFLGSMGRKEEFDKFKGKMKRLGIEVKWEDSVIDVAKRLKKAMGE